jgi:hypothetical protein
LASHREADGQQLRLAGRRREAQGVLGVGLRDAADDVDVDVHVDVHDRGADHFDDRGADNVHDGGADDDVDNGLDNVDHGSLSLEHGKSGAWPGW